MPLPKSIIQQLAAAPILVAIIPLLATVNGLRQE